jgi:ribosomal protein S18 acetylase RimI-like enzyme
MADLSLLPISGDDLPFVRTMLYEAAYWRGMEDAPPIDEALRRPELARYIDHWGRRGDGGLVARIADAPAGAAWLRLFDDEDHGYGYVDDQTPELAIAVDPTHRGRGIGRCLLTAVLAQARLDDVASVSLSVETDNPSRALYESVGFEAIARVRGAVTMVRTLRRPDL